MATFVTVSRSKILFDYLGFSRNDTFNVYHIVKSEPKMEPDNRLPLWLLLMQEMHRRASILTFPEYIFTFVENQDYLELLNKGQKGHD